MTDKENHNNKNSDEQKQAKRSNRAWSDCDERELIKLKSLNILTWNKIGECLQRTGAACQLHWKTMKNLERVREHITHIKANQDHVDADKCDADYDIAVLIHIDKVLSVNQWSIGMLDTLWKNVQKEAREQRLQNDEELEDQIEGCAKA